MTDLGLDEVFAIAGNTPQPAGTLFTLNEIRPHRGVAAAAARPVREDHRMTSGWAAVRPGAPDVDRHVRTR